MKLWNLNNGEETSMTAEELSNWLVRNNAECLARHDDVTYWRTWESPFTSEIWRVEK